MGDTQATAAELDRVTLVRSGRTILDDLSCSFPAGRCTALMGANGCGKTTITRVLTGAWYPTRGRVTVLGQTLGQTNIQTLRRRVALVNPTIDAGAAHHAGATVDARLTTLEAVCTGYFGTVGLYDAPSNDQRDHAAHLLTQVGLGTHMGQRFGTLSTGEQRRALIARAMVQLPELLILDEPTYGLDIAGREHVLATVQQVLAMAEPPTVVMITHHVEELLPDTARLVLMQHGKVLAAGDPEQVVTPELLSRAFGCKVYVRRVHGRYWPEVLPEAWVDLISGRPPRA